MKMSSFMASTDAKTLVSEPSTTGKIDVNLLPPVDLTKVVGPSLHIFADNAPRYFAKNLPVIPLDPMSKGTRMEGWQSFHDHMPTEELQKQWIANYQDGNMGLVLGAQSGISMIDIDTEDPKLIAAITSMLPDSPWCKIGKKGVTLAFKYNGTRSFRIRGQVGGMIVEHLSSKTQTVMPPSIHPDTRRPYVANRDLCEVVDFLQELPLDIEERLRNVLVTHGIQLSTKGYTKLSDRVSLGSRDVTLTQRAGLYATLVVRGEKTLLEAAGELRANISVMVDSVPGDPVESEKHVRNMFMFVKRDVLERKKKLPKGWDAGLTEEQKAEMGLHFGENDVEWNATEIIAYLKNAFETNPVEGEGRAQAIDKMFDQVKNSKTLKDIDTERVLAFIVQASGMNVKLTTLRKALRERKVGEMTGVNQTQIAEAMIEDYKRITELRFTNGMFWRWGGSHWIKMEESEVLSKIIKEYGELPAAKKWGDHRGIFNVMSTLVKSELSEVPDFGVNFQNGFLRRDMVLEDHKPSQGMTYTLPYRYMPEDSHRCPKWLKCLQDFWGDDPDYLDKVEALRDVMCATMFGLGTSMQRAVLLYGIPHSGKSVIMKVMMGLMDPNTISTCSPKMWGDKFSPVQMVDKLMNVCGELDDQKIHGAQFKAIVGGDPIEVQYKGKQNFTMTPMCTHWFCSNVVPKSTSDDGGFNRRWLVLTFNKKVKQEDSVLRYEEMMLAEEREAICAWVMEAAAKFKTQVIPVQPESHKRFCNEMFNMHNSVRMFLMDSGLVAGGLGSDEKVDEHTLHQRYWSYCVQSGLARPVSQKFFRPKAREFEMDVGFKIEVGVNPRVGGEEASYVGLQLTSKR